MLIILIIIAVISILFFINRNAKKSITPDNPIRKMVHSVLEKEFRKEPVTVGDYLDSEYFVSFYENCLHSFCNAHFLRELNGIMETIEFKLVLVQKCFLCNLRLD